MPDTIYLAIIGACGATVFLNIIVMLLIVWRMMNRPKQVKSVKRVSGGDLDDTITTWTSSGFKFLAMRESATGVYTVWFQEK